MADNNSKDNGDNTNIEFAPGGSQVIGLGLGATQTLDCTQYPYTLSTALFYPDPAATFQWSTGATTPTIAATAAGKYKVSILYGNGTVSCPESDSVILTENFPSATNSGTTSVLVDDTPPLVTFTGSGGTPPYTFTYNINGGSNMTVTTNSTFDTVSVAQPTDVMGTFKYNLVSVYDQGNTGCTNSQTSAATISVVYVLPISLNSFTAQKQNNEAVLNWSTAQEVNSSYFGIERSVDDKSWAQIWTGNCCR